MPKVRAYALQHSQCNEEKVLLHVMSNADVKRAYLRSGAQGAPRPKSKRGKGRNPVSRSPARTGAAALRDADCLFLFHVIFMCPSRRFPVGERLDRALSTLLRLLRQARCMAIAVLDATPKGGVPHYHLLCIAMESPLLERLNRNWLRLMEDPTGARGAFVCVREIKDNPHEQHLRKRYLPKMLRRRMPHWYDKHPIRRWARTGAKAAKPEMSVIVSRAKYEAWLKQAGRPLFYKRQFGAKAGILAMLADSSAILDKGRAMEKDHKFE